MQTCEILKQLRKKTKLSMKDFCEDIGINFATYQNYETGKRLPTAEALIVLADYHDVSTDFILGRTPKNELVKQLSAQISMTETEQKLLENYISLTKEEKAAFNNYIDSVASKLIDGIDSEIKQATAEPIKAAASTPTESQILQMGDKQPRELTEEEVRGIDLTQKPYFMTE